MDNLDYGIIGNCRSAALISKTGAIEWCCLPEFDSSSVFAKILDEKI
jgi:GH15 family glucan-1,4-alpha-glucosidase